MPRVVKMLSKSKGALKHNKGPMDPITRKEVKTAGSLEQAYKDRAPYEPFAAKVAERIEEHPIPTPKAEPKKKKKPLLQRYGEKLVSPKTKKGLKLTPER